MMNEPQNYKIKTVLLMKYTHKHGSIVYLFAHGLLYMAKLVYLIYDTLTVTSRSSSLTD